MSSPTSKACAITAKGRSNQNTTSPESGFTTLSIGREDHRIPIAKIVPLSQPSWEKNACFRQLVHAIRGQIQTHSISDLITAITSRLPIDTNAAFEEAMTVQSEVKLSATKLKFLEPVGFLDSHGKTMSPPESMDVADRPAGLNYVHLTCTLDGNAIDDRITQPPLSFDFCLKLRQSNHNKTTGEITPLGSNNLPMKPDPTTPKKKSSRLFGSRTVVESIVDITKAKTSRLFGSNARNADGVVSWFGKAEFLDDEDVFRSEFGPDPLEILPVPPVNTDTHRNTNMSAVRRLHQYAEKCMFDVFLELCRADYVGQEDSAGDILAVQAVCQKIMDLKQRYKNAHGRTDVRSPEDLYNLYLRFIPSLPLDPQEWTIPLSATYFNALIDELRSKMLAASFRVPKPCSEGTKSAELESLRKVRNTAAFHYAKLQEEVSLMDRVLSSKASHSTKNQQSLLGKTFYHTAEDSTPGHTQQPSHPPTEPVTATAQVFYHSQSPAEQTLQRYKGNHPNTSYPNPHNLPTRIGPTGKPHPYRLDDPTYLSRFPLGFRGCFKCGADDHNSWKDCPHQRDGGNKKEFFRELWCHKPHLKRSDFTNQPYQQQPVSQSVSHHEYP